MSGPINLNEIPLRCPKQQHYKDARYMTYIPAYTRCKTLSSLTRQGSSKHARKKGNKYIIIVVEIESNAILADPIKSHKAVELM